MPSLSESTEDLKLSAAGVDEDGAGLEVDCDEVPIELDCARVM